MCFLSLIQVSTFSSHKLKQKIKAPETGGDKEQY